MMQANRKWKRLRVYRSFNGDFLTEVLNGIWNISSKVNQQTGRKDKTEKKVRRLSYLNRFMRRAERHQSQILSWASLQEAFIEVIEVYNTFDCLKSTATGAGKKDGSLQSTSELVS